MKVRIYDVAKELSVSPKEIVTMLGTIGVTGKVASSSIEETAAQSLRQMVANRLNPQPEKSSEPAPEAKPAHATKFQSFKAGSFHTRGAEGDSPDDGGDSNGQTTSTAVETAPPPAPEAPPRPAAPAPAQNGQARGPVIAPNAPSNGAPPYNRAPGNFPPRPSGPPAPGVAPAVPGAAPPAPGGGGSFAQGPRDRRAMKQGRFRGRDRYASGPRFGDRDYRAEVEQTGPTFAEDKKIILTGAITVAELADRLRRPPAELIKKLFAMSLMRAANQPIEIDVAAQLAGQYGFALEVEKPRAESSAEGEEDQESLVTVPPVVTIMGHVDHGKTSLLDMIRSSNVQRGEAGGITQRIGAYETEHNGERIVFLDTPGHEAFTRMRARGAHVTDIAVLVVAADDGIMPQTREAIDHARAAKVPIIIAMNKMDRAEADPDRLKGQLAEVDLIPEDYGGDTIVIPVSAKTGAGVQELLDMILLVAELQELKANASGLASGTIIEAKQDAGRGPVATVLIHRGTLHVGDHVVVGDVYGRVRAMLDYKGDSLQEAGPKTPVFIMGLSAVPHASDSLQAVESAREARETAIQFREDSQEARGIGMTRSLSEMMARIQQGGVKELNVIVKADAQGSVEAMTQSLEKMAHQEVRVKIISRGAGNVSESDVMLASASDAIIIAFAVGTEGAARSLADREKIEIRNYDVIYDAINDVKAALEGMLKPLYEEKLMGEADVKATFKSTKAGVIAGCYVREGKLIAGSILRVLRKGNKVYEGELDSLRHVKSEVKEMTAGQECGVSSKNFNDFQEGDVLQSIVQEQIKRSIDD